MYLYFFPITFSNSDNSFNSIILYSLTSSDSIAISISELKVSSPFPKLPKELLLSDFEKSTRNSTNPLL